MSVFAEEIRIWRRAGFTLELFDTDVPTGTGRLAHTFLAFRLWDGGEILFEGDRFSPPLSVAIDSDECLASLLFWLSLVPGEVEDDYFEGYSPAQLAWMESGRAGELSALLWEIQAAE